MNKLNNLFTKEEPKKQQPQDWKKDLFASNTTPQQQTRGTKENSKLTKLFDDKLEIKPEPKKQNWGNKKFKQGNYEDDFPSL
jgi:hypothetical protein